MATIAFLAACSPPSQAAQGGLLCASLRRYDPLVLSLGAMKTFLKECRWGRFLLLRGDMVSVYSDFSGEWSQLEVKLFRTLLAPESNVVEIGGNLGLHSVPLAKFANKGKVI